MFKIFITFKRWLIIVSTSWFAHPTQHLSNTRKGGKPTLLEDFSGLTSFSIMIWSQRWSFNLSMMRSSEQQFRNYWQLFTATSLATAFLTRELSFARPWTGRQVQHRGFVRRGWPHHLHHHQNRHHHHKPLCLLLLIIQYNRQANWQHEGSRRWTRSWTRRPAWRRTCPSSQMVATTCSARWGKEK